MTIIPITGTDPSAGKHALQRAIADLSASTPIIIPTDTVYGLAVQASDRAGRDQIFALKQRPESQTLAILVADLAQAATLVHTGAHFQKLADAHWPGALTIVAEPAPGADPTLGADDGWIGVRAPQQEWVRRLAANVGPIAATSANIHGSPTPGAIDELAALFPNTTLFDGGAGGTVASTVIRLDPATDQLVQVVREGPVTAADIANTLST